MKANIVELILREHHMALLLRILMNPKLIHIRLKFGHRIFKELFIILINLIMYIVRRIFLRE
jgi:hypothetical protein